jgi:hypothetical protein
MSPMSVGFVNRGMSQVSFAQVSFEARKPKPETMKKLAATIQTQLQAQYPGATCTFQDESWLKPTYPNGVFTLSPKQPFGQDFDNVNSVLTFKKVKAVEKLLTDLGAKPLDQEYWQLKGAHVRFSTWSQFKRGV